MGRRFAELPRPLSFLLGVGALVAVVGTGCLFSSAASGGDDQSSGGDVAVDAGGGMDAASSCESANDCSAPNVESSCNVDTGQCVYSECEGDFVDLNDDLSDGCECLEDNVDTSYADCDGDDFAPEGATAERFCETESQQTASGSPECGGQWVNREPAGGENTPDCDDSDADIHPGFTAGTDGFDEGWLCDGRDNDCDDQTDEVCCGTREEGWAYGEGAFGIGEGTHLELLDLPPGAGPEGAASIAVWTAPESGSESARPTRVRGQYIHRTGELMEPTLDENFADGDIYDRQGWIETLAAVRTTERIVVMAGMSQEGTEQDSTVVLASTDLEFGDLIVADDLSRDAELGGADLSVHEGSQMLTAAVGMTKNYDEGAIIIGETSYDYSVEACRTPVSSLDECEFGTIGISETSLQDAGLPETLVYDGASYAAWWDSRTGQVRLAELQSGDQGISVTTRSNFGVATGQDGDASRRIELVARQTEGETRLEVIHPDFDGPNGHANLNYSRHATGNLSFTSEGTLAQATESLGHRDPTGFVDGENGELMLSWREVSGESSRIATAIDTGDASETVSPKILAEFGGAGLDETGGGAIADVERGYLTGWAQSSSRVLGHYLSPEAKPICSTAE